MYLPNKYTRIYFMIIDRAKLRTLSSYTELHHILPKSLGGSNDNSNLVALTPREHFICHKLLTKMVTGKHKSKMMYAYRALAIVKNPHRSNFKINAVEFERLRTLGLRKGVITSNETKMKLSASRKGQNTGENNPMYGKPRSQETRNKISNSRKEKSNDPTWNIRPPCTKEKAERIKQSNTGKVWVHNPLNPIERKQLNLNEIDYYINIGWIKGTGPRSRPRPSPKLTCPHCKISCQQGLYTRWHGDNCKVRK